MRLTTRRSGLGHAYLQKSRNASCSISLFRLGYTRGYRMTRHRENLELLDKGFFSNCRTLTGHARIPYMSTFKVYLHQRPKMSEKNKREKGGQRYKNTCVEI